MCSALNRATTAELEELEVAGLYAGAIPLTVFYTHVQYYFSCPHKIMWACYRTARYNPAE